VTLWLLFIGKPRDQHANTIAAEFVRRSARWVKCEMREIDPLRSDWWEKHASATKVLCDPAGKAIDSARFTELVRRHQDEARDLVFVVGGHEGIEEEWKRRADLLLSLSPLTFSHELARAMLAEQIYRALATLRGHPYPR
jgi:23S rRNA (pseudouridine1915-N3)-methyltransferase